MCVCVCVFRILYVYVYVCVREFQDLLPRLCVYVYVYMYKFWYRMCMYAKAQYLCICKYILCAYVHASRQ
jgi:hypothetical protein